MFTAFYNIMLMDTSVEVGFAALQEYFRRVIAVPWVFDLGPSDFYETLQGSPYEVAKRFVDFVSAVNNAPAPPPPFVCSDGRILFPTSEGCGGGGGVESNPR
jgi:hypothetical protein